MLIWKNKMLGFLKTFFGKPVENKTNGHSHSSFPAAPLPRSSTAKPFQPVSKPATQTRSAGMSTLPADVSPRPAGATNGHHASAHNGNGNSIHLPLHTILNGLPLELKARIREAGVGELTISLPTEQVLAQLSLGAVKITFGELRAAVPGVFSPEPDRDQLQVALPLNEILARLNPALLNRRASQKQIEVPEEIHSPFATNGAGLSFGTTAKPAPVRPANPVKPPSPAKPISPAVPPARTTPPPAPAPMASIPFRGSLTSAPTPPPPTAMPPGTPPARPAASTLRGMGVPLAPKPMPAPAVAKQSPANPVSREIWGDTTFSVPLAALSEGWPEVLRLEISQLDLADARVALPANQVGPALKQGKVAFTWKVVRSWIQPAVLPTVSAHDSLPVELPLKAIAPLFMARQKELSQPQRKVAIDESIPNLFFGFPQTETSASVVPPATSAPAKSKPLPQAQPSQAVAKPVDTNFYVWNDTADSAKVDEADFKRRPATGTDFLSRCATPNEVVSRAAALDGVAGALVALPDGLMVASKLSPDLNGDTLAAFLPHIFGKVSQCTKELRMGDLNNLNFTVGNIPWKIFRVNAIFFAAFGHAGQPLPTGQLAALAGELDRKKQ
jgi:predicted regulator of Ras-like GTPase activity (Roadblock/LC7/MglB family)